MFGTILTRSNSHGYEEIPSHHHPNDSRGNRPTKKQFWDREKILMLGMVGLLMVILFVQGVYVEERQEVDAHVEEILAEAVNSSLQNQDDDDDDSSSDAPRIPFVAKHAGDLPLPAGVNLGSWLSLEDYFFAGLANSIEVATPDDQTVAQCLPPLHVGGSTGPMWNSETDLFMNLIETKGARHAVDVFAAHRGSFVDLDTDLKRIASLGITSVRIPISWCLTDVDPTRVDLDSYESDEALLEDFACVDPFFGLGEEGGDDSQRVLWPAVPRPLVEDILRACAEAGVRASLDVHTLPGGTSPGTFSGVWPKRPRFWTHGGDGTPIDAEPGITPETPGFGIGHTLLGELVAWMEDLAERDPFAFSGLQGISPMNEPAHLAAFFTPDNPLNFLPPLPSQVEAGYEARLAGSDSAGKGAGAWTNPKGDPLRVFYWFDRSLEIFRNSSLPQKGIEFQANIIESIIGDLGPTWQDTEQMKIEMIAKWWCAKSESGTTTTAGERADWAVLDIHHYNAWGVCSGTIDGQDASYACEDVGRRRDVLGECSLFMSHYRDTIDDVCGFADADAGDASSSDDDASASAKLMSGEFSPASHHTVRESCTDVASLKDSYLIQMNAGLAKMVSMFYWSYKMPYGGSFRDGGWSFSHTMYRFGILDRPDVPGFPCGN